MAAQDQWLELNGNLKDLVLKVATYSSQFGQLRIWSKSLLIVLSAIVAGEKSFHFCGWNEIVAGLAIIVAAGTAADAWIKPAEKWRISSEYATKFAALHRKVLGIDHTNTDAIIVAETEFRELQAQWLKDTTY